VYRWRVVINRLMEPILAKAVPDIPGPAALPGGVVFEPKWDGFRVLVFTNGREVLLRSRRGTDLTVAFPEIAAAASALGEEVVIDGEAVIYRGGRLDFSALQRRLNRMPAATARLAAAEPAHLIAFDLLRRGSTWLLDAPYRQRRAALEALFADHGLAAPWALSPTTRDWGQAQEWMRSWTAVGVEGLVAKGVEQTYQPGRRGWYKIRAKDTAEAIIGAVTGPVTEPDSALLGRYDPAGELRLVARTTSLGAQMGRDLGRVLVPAGADHPWHEARFTTAWGSRRPLEFTPVAIEQVAEFQADVAVDRGRWRHPVRLVRLRADMSVEDVPQLAGSEA
jgi:ATP-dependent DNA ligase